MLGMLSPSSRGALISTMCFLFVFMGIFAGYYSARLYKSMKGKEWKQTAILMAILYPSIIFGICFLLNLFVWHQGSSRAVPFTTMLALLWHGFFKKCFFFISKRVQIFDLKFNLIFGSKFNFGQKFDFRPKIQFSAKNSFIGQKFDFRLKIIELTPNIIFYTK